MSSKNKISSGFLSLVLRHKPDEVGITLDDAGWVDVQTLMDACNRHGKKVTLESLREIVASSDKKRFAFSEDGKRIRANQGHSVDVDLGLQPTEPPEFLYHGTVEKFVPAIKDFGLDKRSRTHVHLSTNLDTATAVGERRGEALILKVRAGQMHREGFAFFVSANGVWLTDKVPPEYIEFPHH